MSAFACGATGTVVLALALAPSWAPGPTAVPQWVEATGHDSCIYLRWQPQDAPGTTYAVERAPHPDGPFQRLGRTQLKTTVFCDWLGENGKTYWYRIVTMRGTEQVAVTRPVSATSVAEDDEALLTFVQEATFRYFWDYAHPLSGMARERYGAASREHVVTIGGTGFGLMALVVGSERGFVSKEAAAERTLKILEFLERKARRYHGAWSHWLDGATGETIPFGKKRHNGQPVPDDQGRPIDGDGGDLVETAYLVQGLLTVRQYFQERTQTQSEVRELADRLWRQVEWDWYLNSAAEPDNLLLYWHWSPDHGFGMGLKVVGFNECMIVYLLAIASPTHPIPPECYYQGWCSGSYENGREFYGRRIWVGPDYGGPLFFTHYSYLGFDPRGRDAFCNYFENHRNIALTHQEYCRRNPEGHAGYSSLVWGITASDGPDGYRAKRPGKDDGTIAATAALSSMPYTPSESIQALKHMYHTYGARLWGPFGFRDAFNLGRDWFADSYLAIDQGPIVIMIENYRTSLLWDVFMSSSEIPPMLAKIGWRRESADTVAEG